MRFLALALLLLLSPATAPAAKRSSITIGYNLAEKSDRVAANGKRLSDYVKKKLGLEVRTYVAENYGALVDQLKAGKIDFAFFPPFSLVKAEETARAHILLKAVRRGRDQSFGAIIVRKDSGIEGLADLKGKSMGWVDAQSATGYLIPRADLAQELKVKPDSFLATQTFFKTHDALVKAVFDSKVNAGATWVNDPEGKSGAWHRHLKNSEQSAKIRMIHVSAPLPGDALATTEQLWKTERAMVEKVTKVLQRMGEALDGQQILRDLYGIDKMVPASSKDFDPVRAAARAIKDK